MGLGLACGGALVGWTERGGIQVGYRCRGGFACAAGRAWSREIYGSAAGAPRLKEAIE